MEGFLSINWDKAVDESSSFFSRDVFNQSSAAYHQLHGIHQTAWSNDEETSSETNTGKAGNAKWIPSNLRREVFEGVGGQGKALKVQSPVPFPRTSVLGPTEQKDYLHAILRVMRSFMNGTPNDPSDILRIRELQKKLKDEIQDFQMFAQSTVHKNPLIYSNINPGIAKYVSVMWKAQLESVKLYPAFYKLIGNLALIPKESIKTIDFTLQFTALELGRVPAPIFPALNTLIKLQRNHSLINRRYPSTKTNQNDPISRDLNAFKLSNKYEVEIAVSSNTLRSLAGNIGPFFKNSWDIPFTVKEMNVKGTTKTVIFIDDPLPPLEMTAVEKNTIFNALAVKYQFINTNRSRHHIYHHPLKAKSPEVATHHSDDLFDSPDLSHLETFGVETNQAKSNTEDERCGSGKATASEGIARAGLSKTTAPIPKCASAATDSDSSQSSSLVIDTDCGSDKSPRKSNRKRTKPNTNESDSSEQSLVIDTGNDSDSSPQKKTKIVKGKTQAKPSSDSTAASSNLLNIILQDQQKMMQSNRKPPKANAVLTEPEDPKDYVQPKHNQNSTYRFWTLRANDKSLRLLVRSSVDTALVTPNGEFRTFVMVPKLEYQPWFGAECLTQKEIYEQWIDLHLRPESKLFRVRLDAYTGDLFTAEQKDAACLEAEINFQYGDQMKSSACLNNLWAVLSSLCEMKLRQGSYLLRHGFHDGICVQIWESTDEDSSSLNLHKTYAEVDTTLNAPREVSDQWLALDPWAMFPIQRSLGRPPLTFEPSKENYKALNMQKKAAKKNKANQAKQTPTAKKNV